jgi:O-antigen/teichoic acid export membrane protein
MNVEYRDPPMSSNYRRRVATALGSWGATALGILGTVIAARVLDPAPFGRLTLVLATVALFQLLLDLTSEEAVVKYGFRYAERADWGRFRRLLELAFGLKAASAVAAGALVLALSPLDERVYGAELTTPLLIASVLPLLYSIEGTAASALILRGRYDVRAWFLGVTMALRLIAIVIGAPRGVTATVVALVVAQVAATAAIGAVGLAAARRFPRAPRAPLAEDRREIVRFLLGSSLGTGIVSIRAWIAPVLLGVVSDVRQVGFFRAAQAPQQGFGALSSPIRLILLTEQTRDWERGRAETVLAGVRRYTLTAAAVMAVAVPLFWWLMPDLVRLVLGERFTPATDAARVILLAAAVQLVFGWTKSLPVSIGRPGLRVVAHGIETAVLVPLLVVFGREWGATGAAVAVTVSTLVFAVVWTFLLARLRGHPPVQVSTA